MYTKKLLDCTSDYCNRGMFMSAKMIKAVQFKLTNHSSNRRSAYSYEDHERNCMNNTIYCIDRRNVYILLSFENERASS